VAEEEGESKPWRPDEGRPRDPEKGDEPRKDDTPALPRLFHPEEAMADSAPEETSSSFPGVPPASPSGPVSPPPPAASPASPPAAQTPDRAADNPQLTLIRELCSFKGRGPGTDAERRAANMLAGKLRSLGRRAEVEPTYIHPQYATVHLLHVAIAIAGSLLAVSEPAIGFALVLFAATSAYLDLNSRLYILRSLFFRRASQNVVSPGPNPSAPLRLILVAHYDAGRSGFIFGHRGRRFAQRLSEPARVLLSPSRVMFWGGMVPLLPILGARMAGIDADWLSVVQLVPTILLIVAAFLLVDIALSDTVPGAYDNASGVAAVLTAAQRLKEDPPANVDAWVVLTGSNESLGEGMRAWVRRHKDELDRDRTVIVNVNGASYGTVHYELSEGPVITYGLDPELIELCEALASSTANDEARSRPLRSPFATEALPARVRGLRAISLIGADHGLLPPTFHAHEDTPETVDATSQERMTDFVVSLARLLDRGAARSK
jgi:hypothetical protein